MFIFSATCHEAAHALAAKLGGDDTAYAAGQVSLNPVPHIQREPVGMVVIPAISFFLSGSMIGWASAPYDPYWAARHPKRAALMALAGPSANLALFLVGIACMHAVLFFGADLGPEMLEFLGRFSEIFATLNLLLFVFNMIPVPPLDGAEIILLFFPEHRAEEIRHKLRGMGMIGFLVVFLVFPKIFSVVQRVAFTIFGF
ncbi:site-2 protease family protein [Acanthopleuribacter pedis]|uniref:Site-2 protease family protein n=1 Tax=Acanthopleuribacter pedis TaxID=442870 RepID=A0A8J7QHV3_9BACT|nr:site-2 protease family protein [Acanthopleuribacter pedis]